MRAGGIGRDCAEHRVSDSKVASKWRWWVMAIDGYFGKPEPNTPRVAGLTKADRDGSLRARKRARKTAVTRFCIDTRNAQSVSPQHIAQVRPRLYLRSDPDSTSPHLWVDKQASATGTRFYRATAMEPPINMVFIPPGTFRMGSPDDEADRFAPYEGPQKAVLISRGFWMGKYEVTQGDYEAVMGVNPELVQRRSDD